MDDTPCTGIIALTQQARDRLDSLDSDVPTRDSSALIDRAVAEILDWDELRGSFSKLPESLARVLANRMHALYCGEMAECSE